MDEDLINIIGLGEFSVKKNYYNELEREKIQFERIFSEALNGIIQTRTNGEVIIVNPALWKMCGYINYRDFVTTCNNIGRNLFYSVDDFNYIINELRKRDKIIAFETRLKKANGESFYVSLDAHMQNDRGVELLEMFVQDIDLKKKAQKEARKAQRFTKNILNASTIVSIISTDTQGTITQFNRGAEIMLGYSSDELVGKFTPGVFHLEREMLSRGEELSAEYGERIEGFEVFVRKARNEGSEAREWTYVRKDGERFTVNLSVTAIKDEHSEIIGFLGIAKDVTWEKKSKQELIDTQKMVNSIIDSMPSVIIGVDSFISITLWNSHAERVTDIPKKIALGQNPFVIYHELSEFQDEIIKSIDMGEIYTIKKVLIIKKGEREFRDITVFPISSKGFKGGVIRVDDVTEQVKLEELIVQSEKMLSVGGLAAGMAHEINNPLAGIIQYTQTIDRRLFSPLKKNIEAADSLDISFNTLLEYMKRRDIHKMLEGINNSVLRASRIVRNMLSFARKSEDYFEEISMSSLANDTLELAENEFNLKNDFDFKSIKIVREFDKNDKVVCDPSKIQQVIYNIIKNGAEAMESVAAPRFIFRVFSDSGYQVLEIEDNGHGIPESVRKRIFEPFYTTKGVGKGTGLGLSVSYFIISELHKGELTVDSLEGHWTRFKIKLPKEEGYGTNNH